MISRGKMPDSEPPKSPSGGTATHRETARIAADGLFLVAFLTEGIRVTRLPSDTTLTVGRTSACDVRIDHLALSRRHFSVREGRPPMVRDLSSANGTRVNGVKLRPNEATPVELGHLIEAGGVFFMLRDHDPRTEFRAGTAWPASANVPRGGAVVVEDPAMVRLHRLVEMVARSTLPVLIVGETGVGKEIVSTAVHARSPRANRPLVRVNCAALPESLLESELFGFEKGAFTGASQAKRGLIDSADGGSFLLDEIGEMPLATQAKLLRVLESGEIMRLGALKPRTVDVRFIAATNRELPVLVAQGRFRRDLYYRLNGITIPIPPLRERPAEIAKLAQAFLATAAARAGRPAPALSAEAVALLERHTWPGNVRELKNVMERAATICTGGELGLDHVLIDPDLSDTPVPDAHPPTRSSPPPTTLPSPVLPIPPMPPVPSTGPAPTRGDVRAEPRGRLLRVDAETERRLIERALEEAGGNQVRAAQILGISRRTLINRLDLFGLKRPRKTSD
jgi:transcriptional regulator with GAF, ATPase, and Fis domain